MEINAIRNEVDKVLRIREVPSRMISRSVVNYSMHEDRKDLAMLNIALLQVAGKRAL